LSSGSAALADYNNDGLMDIYYARSDGPDELWRNAGNGTYILATEEAGLGRTAHHRYVDFLFCCLNSCSAIRFLFSVFLYSLQKSMK